MTKECPFCNDLEGHGINASKLVGERLGDSRFIFAQSQHLNATAELFPTVTDPYFLITPREHHNNFRDVEHREEMGEMIDYLREVTNKPSFVSFEHGEVEDGKKVQSVYHAHTHFIFTDRDYLIPTIDRLREIGFDPKVVQFQESYLNGEAPIDGSYYMFRQGENGVILPESDVDIPSQFFKRIVAEIQEPDKPYIDWKRLNEDEWGTQQVVNRLQNLPLEELV